MIEAIAQLIKRRSPAQDAGSSCSNRAVATIFFSFFYNNDNFLSGTAATAQSF